MEMKDEEKIYVDLATNEDWTVRWILAQNTELPAFIYEVLSLDDNEEVCLALLDTANKCFNEGNSNGFPIENVILRLAMSKHSSVRKEVASSPMIFASALGVDIIRKDEDLDVRSAFANNEYLLKKEE